MSIPFDDNLQALYFISGHDQDWMAGIIQNPDGTLSLRYRFRDYDPDDPGNDPHSDKDVKRWTSMTSHPGAPLEDALQAVQQIMDRLLAAGFKPKNGISCTLIRGSMTTEQFAEAFSKLPFVHKREAGPDDLP